MQRSPLVCDLASAQAFLLDRVNYERTTQIPYRSAAFKLDRMRRLMALLGDPHLGLKAVHIAGTKGKGSTAAMLASILRSAGLRTGLYTSPHLERIEERIVIDGVMCPQERFVALAARLQDAVDRLGSESYGGHSLNDNRDESSEQAEQDEDGRPTFFEITTAMAFLHFAEEKVDAAVLEVGLGGRLDSTNVCRPAVSIITSISFDHMRQLGPTLALIAGEKAGIIKPGVPVISGVLAAEPREVIARQARELGAPLFQRGEDFDFVRNAPADVAAAFQSESFDYREPPGSISMAGLAVALPGEHQVANAACAVAAAARLRAAGWAILDSAIRQGLATARCPARVEMWLAQPAVVLDVAHNPASVAALVEVLVERLPQRQKVLIFASSRDKDYAAMLQLLVPHFRALVLTRYVENPRAVEAEQLAAIARELTSGASDATQGRPRPDIRIANRPTEAWQIARELAGPNDVICITGSFFLASELQPVVAATKVGGNEGLGIEVQG